MPFRKAGHVVLRARLYGDDIREGVVAIVFGKGLGVVVVISGKAVAGFNVTGGVAKAATEAAGAFALAACCSSHSSSPS